MSKEKTKPTEISKEMNKEIGNANRSKFDRLCLSFRNAATFAQRQRAIQAIRRLERLVYGQVLHEPAPRASK